jgi:hypothetical protein
MPNWTAARAVLRGEAAFDPAQFTAPSASMLPVAERRRAPLPVRLALAAAQEAVLASGLDAAELPSVFASSSGCAEILHELCAMLAAGDYQISPTKFHNSVHNAVSGYYMIAAGSMHGASSLCAFDGSAAAGLLETAVQAIDGDTPVLLVAFDTPYPMPLAQARPMEGAWAIALLLAPVRGDDRLTLHVSLTADAAATTMTDVGLAHACRSNPAARLLPLLAALALDDAAPRRVALALQHGGALVIELR